MYVGFFCVFFVAYGHIDHQEASLPFWLCDTAWPEVNRFQDSRPMSWHCTCRPPQWLWLKCACALSEVLVNIPSQLFCWRVHTKGASNGVLSPSSDRHTHDSFFAFSPPEYLWWYPVFNFPPHWPWGIFNAVAQHRLMLHCNSVSVSLCKRRVGFQRGENRWL